MDFRSYFRSRQGEMLGLLKDLVLHESPTSDKKAVDACTALLTDRFSRLGAKVTRFAQKSTGDFHLVEYPAKDDPRLDGRILVLGHVDTVWPVGKIEEMPFYVQGDKVFGPGVTDMKAGLVVAHAALKAIRELNLRPERKISLFLNSAEETGDEEARRRIVALAKKSDIVLCLEPALADGALKLQRKGRLVLRFDVAGAAAHAGTPEKGVSAVDALLILLRKMQALRSGDVSVNIGLLGGGENVNVVAESAWAVCDVRFWTTFQRTKILAAARRFKAESRSAKVKCTVQSSTPPLERTAVSNRLFEQARSIASGLGLSLTGGRTGGGSDASHAAGLGRPILDGLGPAGDGLHAENEHLFLPSLAERAALLTELLCKL
ncbi:MAG: M20 family metallopeptidase [Candidatus Aminicenantes bacterium]|nr:M20 family metallopeptidase [Candidatus Aminicenantes bacterium]